MKRPAAAVASAAASVADAADAADGEGRAKRKRRYTEDERDNADVLTSQLMDLADFNSNKTGCAPEFRRRFKEFADAAPAGLQPRLESILTQFKANTPGVHGKLLDAIITERLNSGVAGGA